MKSITLLFLGLTLAPLANAQYRCVENGKTVFQDRPCVAEPPSSTPSGNNPKVVGDAGKARQPVV